MLTYDYFIYALKNKLYLKRGWLLSVFGILPETSDERLWHLGIKTVYNKLYVELNFEIDGSKTATISDYTPGKPLFIINDKLDIPASTMNCLHDRVTTTYGIALINAILIEYPYEGKIKYLNEVFTPKKINKIAYDALTGHSGCTVEMHRMFENGVSMLACLAQTAVPSATRKSITPNPEVARIKPILLEEYKDRMDDPAAVSDLQAKIQALDKDYLRGDPAERFFITNKAQTGRLRINGIYGAEPDYYDESKISVMTSSLSEGWEAKDIPMLANTIRGGSYSRAVNTALGGAEVKVTGRAFQNYTVVKNDCQVKRGLKIHINKNNVNNFEGRYLVGKETPLTNEEVASHLNKVIEIRSPTYCLTEGTSICAKCMGDIIANSNVGIPGLMTGVTTKFLGLFMSLMHTSAMSTAEYDFTDRIT